MADFGETSTRELRKASTASGRASTSSRRFSQNGFPQRRKSLPGSPTLVRRNSSAPTTSTPALTFKTFLYSSAIAFFVIVFLFVTRPYLPTSIPLGQPGAFNVSDPGALVKEFASLLSDDEIQFNFSAKLEPNQIGLSPSGTGALKKLANVPVWAQKELPSLFRHADVLGDAARATNTKVQNVVNRIPEALAQNVVVDTRIIAKKIASKAGKLSSTLGGAENEELGQEFSAYIKSLQILLENSFEINIAYASLDQLRRTCQNFIKETQRQDIKARSQIWKPSPEVQAWRDTLSNHSKDLADYDRNVLAVINYFDGVQTNANIIKHKITSALRELEKQEPGERLPLSQRAAIAESLQYAAGDLHLVVAHNKKQRDSFFREQWLARKKAEVGKGYNGFFGFFKKKPVTVVAEKPVEEL
ncbi:hypothetical protein GLAREA_04839 [Glarea lozoyensis ATCC 20868]|uniref:Uncharacterized protein n=1 Tax=Glarea lozoyensis (strain ATCC 20868 / MF5171) TaxID=1116229 RepID=S3DNJ5_GLAL2|nr:uncharacterized protein GLAREA_04839 [Glarea lozoyensis ATCC 20868]EPE28048.1 hypothetical protein GLAREA_04839 [Glarea lozoyensis ATCC 20868]